MVTISVIISGTVRRVLMNLFDVSCVDLVVESQGLLPILLLLFIHKLLLLLSLLLHFCLNIFHCRFDNLTRSQRNCLILKNFFGLSFLVELHITETQSDNPRRLLSTIVVLLNHLPFFTLGFRFRSDRVGNGKTGYCTVRLNRSRSFSSIVPKDSFNARLVVQIRICLPFLPQIIDLQTVCRFKIISRLSFRVNLHRRILFCVICTMHLIQGFQIS